MSGLKLVNVSKRYGEVSVVERISLNIAPGEFVVLLGPSGCGKSTILRMIAGLETADHGEIHLDGVRIDPLPPGARGVAMVFQNYALYPHMTVRDNLSFGLRNIATPRDEIDKRIAAAAESLEIVHLLSRRPGELSGGQKQRVAIARAIVKEPKAFLFDEPLSNLDAALRSRTRIELAQLHRRLASTMIFVTHDQVEAMTLADRIVVLNERRIEQIGSPMEIYERPATRFVATFAGSPRMNILSANVSPDDNGDARVSIPGVCSFQSAIPFLSLPQRGDFFVGLRPEHVRIAACDGAELRGEIQLVERLGERTLAHVKLPNGEVIVAEDVGASRIDAGEACGLKICAEAAHLFDGDGAGHHARRP
ncbi:ABC transporter ATP-binding protein [Amphiplicatus metriothermophilus]|uniref:Carbohydrate ABC transporter ATP-binding protein, CUT1 family n=1 Tax=Amphiplicatus metriothermophilus TaxID=1519374 RepID=A0A239PXV5_9PROT|nr:sn-glycerol-3-phosphate ABC transporter ATP-binding protein UgpC [Amphiplicatus metriothermophilus]MBB5519808.1 multiple sugar transport system ATP-binding protein [Amphiplicatus metriothermophilus]SNT75151.1 carbohydrate ABC transporter ATP-binding protein, CUT1 family [Amphiplicatus metriothermophilus]